MKFPLISFLQLLYHQSFIKTEFSGPKNHMFILLNYTSHEYFISKAQLFILISTLLSVTVQLYETLVAHISTVGLTLEWQSWLFWMKTFTMKTLSFSMHIGVKNDFITWMKLDLGNLAFFMRLVLMPCQKIFRWVKCKWRIYQNKLRGANENQETALLTLY